MDPELQKSLADLLAYVKKGADFAVAQAPAVAQEIVAWELWSSVVLVCTGIVTLVTGFLAVRATMRNYDNVAAGVFGIIAFPVGFVMTVVNIYFAVRAIVAPRLVIIEYLTTHIK